MKKEKLENIVSTALFAVLGMAVGFSFSHFVMQRVLVHGISMEPTYYDENNLWMKKTVSNIEFNDVVVLDYHSDEYSDVLIKRVIGCPGDEIEICEDGDVIRNGVVLYEEYIKEKIRPDKRGIWTHVVLQEDEYFVMGDNRNASYDSRMIGPVAKDNIVGVVISK